MLLTRLQILWLPIFLFLEVAFQLSLVFFLSLPFVKLCWWRRKLSAVHSFPRQGIYLYVYICIYVCIIKARGGKGQVLLWKETINLWQNWCYGRWEPSPAQNKLTSKGKLTSLSPGDTCPKFADLVICSPLHQLWWWLFNQIFTDLNVAQSQLVWIKWERRFVWGIALNAVQRAWWPGPGDYHKFLKNPVMVYASQAPT